MCYRKGPDECLQIYAVFFHFTICISCLFPAEHSGYMVVFICSVLKLTVSFQHVCGSLGTKNMSFCMKWTSMTRYKPVFGMNGCIFPSFTRGLKKHDVVLFCWFIALRKCMQKWRRGANLLMEQRCCSGLAL